MAAPTLALISEIYLQQLKHKKMVHLLKGKVIPLQAQRVGRGIAVLFHERGTRKG